MYKIARNHACAYGELATAPLEERHVVKFTDERIKSCVEFCLDPERSQMYSFGTKQLVNGATGVATTIPRVMRTTSIEDAYQVRYIY